MEGNTSSSITRIGSEMFSGVVRASVIKKSKKVRQSKKSLLFKECLKAYPLLIVHEGNTRGVIRDTGVVRVLLKRHSSIVRHPGRYVQARSAIPSSTLSSQGGKLSCPRHDTWGGVGLLKRHSSIVSL